MGTTAIDKELTDYPLDVFGQQPGMGIYTQICLCYAMEDPSRQPEIVKILTKGLEILGDHFPWSAGQVTRDGEDDKDPGVFKIKPFRPAPVLKVKDYQNDSRLPSFTALRQAGFPMAMLNEKMVSPRGTLPSKDDPPEKHVFMLQANFITGGLILTFITQHQVTDMTGQGILMEHLSRACTGHSFTPAEIAIGNASRRDIIPLLDDDDDPSPELQHQIVVQGAEPGHNNLSTPAEPAVWAYFDFPLSSLVALKADAVSTIPQPATSYISTDDALTALVWQAVTRARISRIGSPTKVILGRAIDPRRYIGVPANYSGIVQNMAYTTLSAGDLASAPLGEVAAQLRAAVDPKTSNLGRLTRGYATLLHRATDKNTVSVGAVTDLKRDIMISSWANQPFAQLEFGLGLGKPVKSQRPLMSPVEGLILFMPKLADGGGGLVICLSQVEMDAIRADPVFVKYGKYVG